MMKFFRWTQRAAKVRMDRRTFAKEKLHLHVEPLEARVQASSSILGVVWGVLIADLFGSDSQAGKSTLRSPLADEERLVHSSKSHAGLESVHLEGRQRQPLEVLSSIPSEEPARRLMPLAFGLFANTPSVPLVPTRTFDEPEIIPVKVEAPPLKPAHMLILDHDIAAIADDEGVARFSQLPLGFELPMRVVCPQAWPRKGIRFESESLEMDGATFLLKVDDETPQRHVIKIVADEPKP